MTPEWQRQDAVLLAWPDEQTDWQSSLDAIQSTFVEMIQIITRYESVVLLIRSTTVRSALLDRFAQQGINLHQLKLLVVAYDDTWLRDSGPINLSINGQQFMDYRFNGWGNKFDARRDDALCATLFRHEAFSSASLQRSSLILEGGSLDVNDEGVLLTTDSCLLSTTRNPSLSREDYARHFADKLGIQRIIWLAHGELAGDDTDGHIDMLARFCSNRHIVYTACDDPADAHYAELKNMEQELQQKAADFILTPLPIPAAIYNAAGQRLPASYCNFLIINDAVLLPVYNDPADEIAVQRLTELFPERSVIPVMALNIIQQGGSLHCLTMQLNQGCLR